MLSRYFHLKHLAEQKKVTWSVHNSRHLNEVVEITLANQITLALRDYA